MAGHNATYKVEVQKGLTQKKCASPFCVTIDIGINFAAALVRQFGITKVEYSFLYGTK